MRVRAIGIAVLSLLALVAPTLAQFQPPSEKLLIRAEKAWTWIDGASNVVECDGPVTIETDYAILTARQAVVWLTPVPGAILEQQRAEIALIGDAEVKQGNVTRSGDRMFVTTLVRGTVRITAEQRIAENRSSGDTYREAGAIRPAQPGIAPETRTQPEIPIQRPWMTPPSAPPAPPTTAPTTRPIRPTEPVAFHATEIQTVQTGEGNVALILSDGITLFQTRANGDFIEIQANRAVLFTPLKSLRELGEGKQFKTVEDAITSAYLEGDVRIIYTPGGTARGEQRLSAARVYYEFTTDRAVLTDAVLHTIEPTRNIPLIARANVIRQLSLGEYRTDEVELSTSSFATPSYSINADRAYVRQEDTGDPRYGTRTSFTANNATLRAFDVPFFYLPVASGSVTDRGAPLRGVEVGNSSRFGTFVATEWGLFESLGLLPPRDLDSSFSLDYLGDRGPAAGISADYRGGFVSETTRQPWNFEGSFDAWGIIDHGEDKLGGRRLRVEPPDEARGQILFEHQHFFPQDWQAQIRAGFTSDATFLEQYYEKQFDEGLPHDVSLYLKRQRQTEAFTLLVNFQPNRLVTTADGLQEVSPDDQQVPFIVEKLPEIGYYRVGDSFWEDRFTFFSANTAAALKFQDSRADLTEYGFRTGQSPGIPSLGYTGTTSDLVLRGDFRQEIDYPFSMGQFRVVPYIMGRYTPYSDSPDEGNVNRFLAGAGVRITTAFWKVDDTAHSTLFDINRVRHVIEPSIHAFTSIMNTDRDDVFVFDESVDAINDISALQLALRQRWQTKRGGAGRWRSVDFFTLNAELNLFANQPDEFFLTPAGFRGLFFDSVVEESIPRNSINADALWRISDTTALLGDVQYNLDEMSLATTSLGLAVQRDTRLNYFIGARYIGQINSTIASLTANYELSTKYTLNFSQSYNFSERRNQTSSIGLIRRFDRFFVTFSAYYDAIEDESGFRFAIVPEGLGAGISSQQFGTIFGGQ